MAAANGMPESLADFEDAILGAGLDPAVESLIGQAGRAGIGDEGALQLLLSARRLAPAPLQYRSFQTSTARENQSACKQGLLHVWRLPLQRFHLEWRRNGSQYRHLKHYAGDAQRKC